MRNLIRRRFLPVMYDVAPPGQNAGDGWAYDQDAVDVIGPIDELRQGRSTGGTQEVSGRVHADSYPAALFLLPDGRRLGGGLWGILPPERMVLELRAVMAKWPEHFAASAAELDVLQAAADAPRDANAQLAAAQLRFELAEFDAVLPHTLAAVCKNAEPEVRRELRFLRGRALLCLGRDDEARTVFVAAKADADGDALAHIELLLARLAMRAGEHERALEQLLPKTKFDAPARWTGAAMYYAGLCLHRLGRRDEALAMWRRHRIELPFDRLARRSAASLGTDEAEAFLNQELLERKGWW